MTYDPTREQLNIIGHHAPSAYIQACPGAGKTRTIVARIKDLDLKSQPRKGIALISFTNFAVNEFREKCREVGILDNLKYPSFIGTFDSFIWKFIALPSIPARAGITPRLVDSWGDKYINLPHPRNIQGNGAPLSAYNPITREFNGLKPTVEQTVQQFSADYVRSAQRWIDGLNNRGFYSTADARALIRTKLENAQFRQRLASALTGRFSEMIIDEAQDCNDVDISILSWLHEAGLPLKVVCDPGQAIYEFRNADPAHLQRFSANLHALPLRANFRSSPVICSMAATMRQDRRVDDAVGRMKEIREPIALLPFRGQSVNSTVGQRFIERANNLGIDPRNLISLAHDRNSALRAVGVDASSDGTKSSKRYRLAEAVALIKNSGADTKSKEQGIRSMLVLILEAKGAYNSRNALRECIEASGTNEREIRRIALDIVAPLPPVITEAEASAWIELAKTTFQKHVTLQGVTINQFFVQNAGWQSPLTEAENHTQLFPCATIHEAKGCEYEGVLVSIRPRTDVIDSWLNQNFDEGLRVLYVGATRAQRLLGLGIPRNSQDRVTGFLQNAGITFVTVE